MLRGIVRGIMLFIMILLEGFMVKSVVDSVWFFSGLDPKGLSSLITIVAMAFSATFLIPFNSSFKKRARGFIKELLLFLLIWLSTAFAAALLRSPQYIQIGFLASLPYVFLRLGAFPGAGGIRLRMLCGEQSVEPGGQTLLLSVAPVPKAVFLQGFGLKGFTMLLKGRTKLRLRLPEDVFIKSFKHRQTLELWGSLSSLVKTVRENLAEGVAILCEARPRKGSFKTRIEIASDNPFALRRLVEGLSRLRPVQDGGLEQVLEEWCSLKPCVKPVSEELGLGLNQGSLAGRMLIAGDTRDAEKLALQICLSQLRRDSIVLVMGAGVEEGSEDGAEKLLVEKGFRLREKPVKTYRGRDRVEVVFVESASNRALLRKTSSKPVVAVWFRSRVQGLAIDAPVEVLTSKDPCPHPGFKADRMILVNCGRGLAESFLPSRYGFALQGRTVLVSQRGVRILG
jgi:hypothetical protein